MTGLALPPPNQTNSAIIDSLAMPSLRKYQLKFELVGPWIAAGTLVLCPVSCSGPPSRTSSPSLEPVTLTIGFPIPTLEDPLHGVRQAARLASLEGLTTQSVDGRAVPRLAEGWTESPDGLTWTIKLRPTALFHDGTPVDAAAVKAALERQLKGGPAQLSAGLQDIVSLEVSDTYLLTIRLGQRSSLLLDDLETPITKARWERLGCRNGTVRRSLDL